jgi:hypothetical protein
MNIILNKIAILWRDSDTIPDSETYFDINYKFILLTNSKYEPT